MKPEKAKPHRRGKLARPGPNRYPKGLNRKKVQAIIAHYENQTENEAVAEDEAAYRNNGVSMIGVPVKLVPKVHELIARRSG